jgi:hypothetical protein
MEYKGFPKASCTEEAFHLLFLNTVNTNENPISNISLTETVQRQAFHWFIE